MAVYVSLRESWPDDPQLPLGVEPGTLEKKDRYAPNQYATVKTKTSRRDLRNLLLTIINESGLSVVHIYDVRIISCPYF